MALYSKSDRVKPQNHEDPPSTCSERMILTYRGWDAFERTHGGPEIIDFDLSTFEGTEAFSSRRQILSELSKLHDQLSGSSDEEEFLRARIQGSIFYLRALMGEQVPFTEYLKNTLGLMPPPFSDDEVKSARRTLIRWLESFNLSLRAEDRERFESKLLIHEPAEIKEGIVGNQKFWLEHLRETGIPVPRELRFTVQFAEVDAYWSNWISGSAQKGITLTINLHARNRYHKGRPLALCLHEICGHAVQMSIWRELIAKGKLNQACGLTTVHSPEMFACEGLGQTVPDLLSTLPDLLSDDHSFPPEFHLSRALQFHTLIILHNAHLMLYENVPVERVLEYACDNLPFSDPDNLDYEIRDRGTNPLFRSYQLSYAIAEHTIRNCLEGRSISQKRDLFREIYTRPLTPSQLLQVADAVNI